MDVQKTISRDELAQKIRDHAALRIQTFYSNCVAYSRIGVRSDDSLRDIKFRVGRSQLQIGRGTREDHAAHANAASGITDTWGEQVDGELLSDKRFTPTKARLLKMKGLTKSQLDVMEGLAETDPQKYLEFSQLYGLNSQTLIQNTPLHYLSNATNGLPRDVNLKCDKPLEGVVRPQIELLYEHVAKSMTTPEEATKTFCETVLSHFNKKLDFLMDIEQHLANYTQELRDLITCSYRLSQPEICAKIQRLNKTRLLVKTPLPKNLKFLKSCLRKLYYNKISSWEIKRLLASNHRDLSRELDLKQRQIINIFNYTKYESEGSQIPDFQLLNKQSHSTVQRQLLTSNEEMKKMDNTTPPSSPTKRVQNLSIISGM